LDEYAVEGGTVVAARHVDMPVFRVGPHARLPFTYPERQDGIADLPGNAVAMLRTSGKPAALAATLPALRRDSHDGRRGLFAHTGQPVHRRLRRGRRARACTRGCDLTFHPTHRWIDMILWKGAFDDHDHQWPR